MNSTLVQIQVCVCGAHECTRARAQQGFAGRLGRPMTGVRQSRWGPGSAELVGSRHHSHQLARST